ncbi:MAG: hypothetical protein QG641_1837 [Candidatus Poribacteria bacterium]|nr:hypothetical protein [Candidatus Poribacteria bacterium]
MIAKLRCISCIIDDIIGAVESLNIDKDTGSHIVRKCLEYMSRNVDLSKEPSVYITEVHRILKRISGIEVPFAERRRLCNEMGLELEKKLSQRLSKLTDFDKFSMLARWSIAGNAIDFRTVGTGYDFDVDEMERSLYELAENLEIDLLHEIYEKVKTAKRILFVHDNVGEIVLDKLFIKHLRELINGEVISAVRGGAITSDATMDDADQVGLSEVATSIILAGTDTLGISFYEMSQDFKDELSKADLIFAKGQANFYVFSEHKDKVKCPIVCLFRTKCDLVSNIYNFEQNINIATIL